MRKKKVMRRGCAALRRSASSPSSDPPATGWKGGNAQNGVLELPKCLPNYAQVCRNIGRREMRWRWRWRWGVNNANVWAVMSMGVVSSVFLLAASIFDNSSRTSWSLDWTWTGMPMCFQVLEPHVAVQRAFVWDGNEILGQHTLFYRVPRNLEVTEVMVVYMRCKEADNFLWLRKFECHQNCL